MRTEGGIVWRMGTKGHSGRRTGVSRGVMRVSHRGAHWRHKGRDLGGGIGQEKCFFETTGRFSPLFYVSWPGSGGGGVFSHLGRARCPAGRIKNQL